MKKKTIYNDINLFENFINKYLHVAPVFYYRIKKNNKKIIIFDYHNCAAYHIILILNFYFVNFNKLNIYNQATGFNLTFAEVLKYSMYIAKKLLVLKTNYIIIHCQSLFENNIIYDSIKTFNLINEYI